MFSFIRRDRMHTVVAQPAGVHVIPAGYYGVCKICNR